MLPEKRKRVVLFFILMFVMFAALLFYLMLFSQGLNLTESRDDTTGRTVAVVENESSRIIYNVTVSYVPEAGEKTALATFEKLMPGDKKNVSLVEIPEGVEEAKIVAEAPFHMKVEKRVAIGVSRVINFSISISSPEIAFLGTKFALKLEICNQGDAVEGVEIHEQHEAEFFSERNDTKTMGLAEDACDELHYELTPILEGKTTIYFNIKAYDNIQEMKKTVTIEPP